jgi:hypothetical protein
LAAVVVGLEATQALKVLRDLAVVVVFTRRRPCQFLAL